MQSTVLWSLNDDLTTLLGLMTGFDTGILIAYGICPPVESAQYYQMDPGTQPTHFMRGTHTEVWGDDVFEVMHTTPADWDSDDNDDSP